MNEDAAPMEDIFDVVPPVEIPDPSYLWLWLLLGLLFMVLIVAVVYVIRQNAERVNPKDTSLKLLAELRTLAAKMDGNQFGVAVSDILRNYLTQAHDLRASQQTSREFLDDLKAKNTFNERTQERLSSFLETCDFLKYAPAGKATDPNQELIEQANLFIREDTV